MTKILDLYCGVGGLSLGFVLGLDSVRIDGVDINRNAIATYNLNLRRFGCRAFLADVLRWEPDGYYDILIGGVPCQPYSTATGNRRGVRHPLYPTLPRFFDIVLEVKPMVFVMENVKGLVSRRHRLLLMREVRRVQSDYWVAWRVLNLAFFGVPQRRERVFVVGVKREIGKLPDLFFPQPTHGAEGVFGRCRWVTVREAIGDLLDRLDVVLTHKRSLTRKVLEGTWRPFFGVDEPSFTVTGSGLRLLNEEEVNRIRKERENVVRHRARMRFPDDLDMPARTISSSTVEGTKRETIVVPVSGGFRRLSVRECLRLQSFPDWWSFPFGVSVSSAYRMVGEAVPPVFAYRLAVHIGKVLGLRVREPPKEEEWQLPYFRRSFEDYFGR